MPTTGDNLLSPPREFPKNDLINDQEYINTLHDLELSPTSMSFPVDATMHIADESRTSSYGII
jgi:hypothetical protein